jgi:hypothetical protein
MGKPNMSYSLQNLTIKVAINLKQIFVSKRIVLHVMRFSKYHKK